MQQSREITLEAPLPEQARFTGRIEVRKAGIGALRKFVNAGAIRADGILDGAIEFEWKDGFVTARPRLAIDKVRIDGKNLGQTVRIEGGLQLDLDSGLLRTPGTKVLAGDVPVAIFGEVDTRQSRVDITVRTNGAPIAELLAIAAGFGATASGSSGTLECFNLTNTPHFGAPNASVGTNQFGVISSAEDGRIFQLGLRVRF